MLNEQEKLTQIVNLGHEIAQANDLDVLLERILTLARSFFNTDAGSLYIREGNDLEFRYTQNETLQKKLPPGKKLIFSTFSIPVSNESISGYVANTGTTLNIPDVYELSQDLPYSFGKKYDQLSSYRTKSVMTCPLKTHRGETIGVLQLINAKDRDGNIISFPKSTEHLAMHFANNAAIAIERAKMTRAIILRMINIAELRDPKETGAHVNRVASYSVEIYETWAMKKGIPDDQIQRNKDILRMAAMLHDVGKVAIADSILKKPARLDPDEVSIMRQHTFLGARLFRHKYSEFDDASFHVALDHHEYWNGNGYPGHIDVGTGEPMAGFASKNGFAHGKKGEEIHPFGRVVAIADVYDALSSKRVYKAAWDESRVFETLRGDVGKQFDPDMIEAFFDSIDVIKSIAERYPDSH